ncbi:MAG: EamA family transporter [Syntrophomonadaceae bacterium]
MSDPTVPAARPSLGRLVAAFAAVYVLWGSTYLGIRISIETLPPFFTQGVRYMTAGAVIYAWARRKGAARPSRREWAGGAVAGILLFVFGTGGVVWAERLIPSGVAALIVATEPASFVLIEAVRRRRLPRGSILAGIALGAVGLAILVGPGDLLGGEHFALSALLVLVVGTFCWAGGSLFSRGSRLPASPWMATAVTLVTGGAGLAVVGTLSGELARFDPAAISARSVAAFVYLLVFGSLVGFSAYLWLLRNTSVARVSTYAYVNPVIAVVLGWAVAGEPLSARVLLATAVIVGAVAWIIRHGGEDAEVVVPDEADLGCEKAPETLHA